MDILGEHVQFSSTDGELREGIVEAILPRGTKHFAQVKPHRDGVKSTTAPVDHRPVLSDVKGQTAEVALGRSCSRRDV